MNQCASSIPETVPADYTQGTLPLTIEEIESACDASIPLDFSKHPLEAPELSFQCMFYPLGFPTLLRTNCPEIVSQFRDLWSIFEKQFDTKPIRVDVHVVEGGSAACPPAPVVHIAQPLLINIVDPENYSITDLDLNTTSITLSRATLRHVSYLNYFLLESSPLCHITTRYATPVHGACVALNGQGMLLCGDSGAGKSSLSYACARAGWTYITDDASHVLNDGKDRLVTGNCHRIRFRPSAAELFPEVEGLEITPRAAGKPSIEMPTASFPQMVCAPTARVDFVVFLNRRRRGSPELVPYRKDVARYFMRHVLFGSAESLAAQYAALERLLTTEIFELCYTDLDWAVRRLEMLVREGR
jgi:hypothetical protein